MNDQQTSQLIDLAIGEAPELIARLKDLFVKANPGVPPPSNEEIVAAYNSAFASSLAKDNAWLAIHPEA